MVVSSSILDGLASYLVAQTHACSAMNWTHMMHAHVGVDLGFSERGAKYSSKSLKQGV